MKRRVKNSYRFCRPVVDAPNLSYLSGMIGCVTAVKLREWRGVKPVAGPCGMAITARLRTARRRARARSGCRASAQGGPGRHHPTRAPGPGDGRDGQSTGAPEPAQHPQEGVDRGVERAVGQRDHRRKRRPVPAGPRRPAPPHHRPVRGQPAYSSAWGSQYWRTPYENVTRHEAAATVIGRRAQGFKARRREGVTRTRPEDRVVRATDQAAPNDRQATTRNRHRPGTRGTRSHPPSRARTR